MHNFSTSRKALSRRHFIAGNWFAPLVPVTEMPGLPFTFKNSAEVFVALDGDTGDYIRAELLARGIYAFRRGFDNGFRHIGARSRCALQAALVCQAALVLNGLRQLV